MFVSDQKNRDFYFLEIHRSPISHITLPTIANIYHYSSIEQSEMHKWNEIWKKISQQKTIEINVQWNNNKILKKQKLKSETMKVSLGLSVSNEMIVLLFTHMYKKKKKYYFFKYFVFILLKRIVFFMLYFHHFLNSYNIHTDIHLSSLLFFSFASKFIYFVVVVAIW